MRTNEERLAALHSRTAQLKQEDKNRRFAWICTASAAVCLGILLGLAFLIARVSEYSSLSGMDAVSMNASIFSESKALSFIVIAILAFLLGVCVTVFCYRLKKYLDEKNRGDH